MFMKYISFFCFLVFSGSCFLNAQSPVIIEQPVLATTAEAGSSVTLSVTASGESLSYQWQTYLPPAGWQAVEGATSLSYTATYNANSDSGAFRVEISNSAGSVTSEPAQVVVELFTDPSKSYLPTNSALTWAEAKAAAESEGGYLLELNSYGEWLSVVAFLENSFAAMSVEDRETFFATSYAPSGGDAAYLWLGGSDAAVEGEWRWANSGEQFWSGGVNGTAVNGAFNRWGKTTTQQNEPDDSGNQDALALALETWPWVGNNPGFELGSAYQWNDISDDERLYFIIEKDLGGPAVEVPSIDVQPTTQSVTSGSSVTLSVSASGGSLSYQWQKGGVDIAGATTSSYTIASVSTNDAGAYTVVVSNSAGSVNSNAATLAVEASYPAPASLAGKSFILTPSSGGSKSVPDQVTFTADTISFGFSGNLLESDSYSYSDGTVTYDGEEVIEFTYTSSTGGTYEEGDDGFYAGRAGTFVESNISLSLQSNWQRTETMNSQLSTQYWQVGATSGDSVAYNEGELNFIFDHAMDNPEDQEIEIAYAGALPLDKDWQIVIDDTYVSNSVNGFSMGYQLELEGSFDCEFGVGDFDGREVYFYADDGSDGYYSTNQSSADDPRIQNGLNFRILHLASSRELIYSYQPDGVSDWTELARINLSTGVASGLSGNGILTGQLPSRSQNLFFGVDIDKYSTEATPIENIEIGGIEISGYTPPIAPPASLAGKSFILTPSSGGSKSVPDQVTFTADTISFGFSGNLLESDSYNYSDGTVTYDTEEVIEFTYTSSTGGTYEEGYDEGDGFNAERAGTFVESNISLSLQTNWQRTETMNSPLSTQYWQVGATSGDSVAYNEGELNFIFDQAFDTFYPEDQEIEIAYAGALPLDEDWQIVIDDTYISNSVNGFSMGYQLELEGSFDCEFGVGDFDGREVYFYADDGSDGYYSTNQSSADDPRIQNGLNFRIQHLASSRELVYSYQPDGVSDWTELARINLSTGAASGLSGNGTLTGQLPSSSQNLFFGVDIDKYSTEATPIENIEIGGIEISGYAVLYAIESDGEASLLEGGGYYYIDSVSLPITYNGAPVTDYPGYKYIGVEPDGSGGYELILLAEATEVYNLWSVDSAGRCRSVHSSECRKAGTA